MINWGKVVAGAGGYRGHCGYGESLNIAQYPKSVPIGFSPSAIKLVAGGYRRHDGYGSPDGYGRHDGYGGYGGPRCFQGGPKRRFF